MNLNVYNFGKIKSAEIDLKGLTVIAGLNDTGKSTVGKILYGVFNSVKNIDRAITNAKMRALQKAIWESLFNDPDGSVQFRLNRSIYYGFLDDLYIVKENRVDFDALFEYLKKKESVYKFDLTEKIKIRIRESVNAILSVSNDQFVKSIVTERFRDIFNGQINDVRKSDLDAQIHLKVKQKKLDFVFRKDELESFNKEISLINSATYIENPSVLDSLNNSIYGSSLLEDLTEKINNTYYDDYTASGRVEDRVLSKQLALKKIEQIVAELNGVVPGNIDYSDGEYVYKEDDGLPLNVSSLSTGFKSFALIKQLLLNQQLRERDVLILDEPEVHLHPAWQLKYAEIIVLLQKICNLTVVVTTHSSHFLEALDLYSKIHKTNECCSYYFASLDESQRSSFENIAGNLDVIYRSLVEPNFLIDKIKEEKGIE
ncbi:ATP-binding protein [Fibrobacter succinogenes]|uniref:ATP-binding protein n=1 Tax=Fibrobacter succinogenes TaxID=833 RepID=UPI0015692C3E|nr:ATP-binding protein [Fibrobacter succinogenes]